MGSFWEDLGKRLGETAEHVSDRTGEAVELQKLKSQIRAQRKENEEDLLELGLMVYEQYKKGMMPEEEAAGLCEAIRNREESIMEYRRKISDIKGHFSCGGCGRTVANDMQYCPYCGTRMTEEMKAKAADYAEMAKEKAAHACEEAAEFAKDAAERAVEFTKEAAEKETGFRREVSGKAEDFARNTAEKTAELTKEAAEKTADFAKEAAEKTADFTREAAERTVEFTKGAAERTGDAMGEAAREFEVKAEHAADAMQEKAKEAAKRLRGTE